MLIKATRLLHAAGTVVLVALCAAAVYQHSRGNLVAGIYRQRLQELSGRYQELRQQYNQAVRKTAVTELLLEGGRLNVVVRTAEGVLETIPTNLDASREIHVEYVVKEGRLWIRRVYSLTEPNERYEARADVAMVNPSLADLPWTTDPHLQGLSVFRKGLGEGRWIVTATGNAALALTKVAPGEAPELSGPPPVREFPELDREIRDEIDRLSVMDVARRVWSGE